MSSPTTVNNDENVDTLKGTINSNNNNNLSIDMSNIDVNAKSSLPPHMLKSGNIGKVMNSPRIGAPEDKSNDISNMSEFAESAPVEQEKDIRTIEERLNSKKWKDRQAAYRELYDLFQSVKEKPEDPIFEQYQSFVNGCAKDKFAACVVDGLKVCDAFVNYSTLVHNGTFELEEMLNATINNFGQKSSVVNTATELVLSMLKVKKEKDTIVSALVNGAFHKKVKVSSNSVTVLIKVVQYFGIPTIPLTPIQEGMKKMLESKHAVTRKESVKFVQTIYGFTQSLAVFDFSSLKPAMKKEIDDAVANQSKLTALKDDADSKKNDNNMKTSSSANVDTTNNNGSGKNNNDAKNDNANATKSNFISKVIFEAMPEVDITSRIEKHLKFAAKDGEKWSKRKEAIEAATNITSSAGRLSSSCDFGHAYDVIKTSFKDTTLWIRIAAMNLATAFACTGRSRFASYAKRLIPELFLLFKEKKKVHVNAVNACLDAICICCISLEDICDMRIFKLCKAPGTNPFVIENTLLFLVRMIKLDVSMKETSNLDQNLVKGLVEVSSFLSSNGKSPEVRKGATNVVIAIIEKLGKNNSIVIQMLNDLQMSNKNLHDKVTKPKKEKVNNKRSSISKRTSTGSTTGSRRTSGGTGRPSLTSAKQAKGKKMDSSSNKKKKVISAEAVNLDTPSIMTENEAFEVLESMELENWEEIKENIKSSKWKEAKKAIEALQNACKTSPTTVVKDCSEAIIVLLSSATKTFKSSNFNLMNASFNCIFTIAEACVEHSIPFPVGTAAQFIAPSSSKFGDRKMKQSLHNMMLTLAQCATPKFVILRIINAAASLKSPGQLEDILIFLNTCCDEFGPTPCPVKSMVKYAAGDHGLDHKTPKIKAKAESFLTDIYKVVGGKVIQYIGEVSSKRGEALIKTLEGMDVSKSINKKESKRKINVINKAVIAGATEEEDDAADVTDITDRVNKSLFNKLHCTDDKNSWKIRQEATRTVHEIVKSVKGQVECNKGACRIMRELTKQLRSEKNANTEVRIAACITDLIKKCGPSVYKFTKYVIQDVLLCLSSNNKKLIPELVKLLSQWCKHNGEIQTPCVDGIVSYLPSQIKEKGGHLEVAQWMEQFISFATPTELHEVVPSVLVLCQSKNSTTRKSAENVLRIISESAGSNVVSEAFGQLHGVIARTLKPIVDRALNGSESNTSSSVETASAAKQSNTRRASTTTTSAKRRAAPKESRRVSAPVPPTSKTASKNNNNNSNDNDSKMPILKAVPMKKKMQRGKEASRRPWVLPDRPEAPANDLVERMRSNLEQVTSPKFFSFLFSNSTSQKLNHISKACDMLKGIIVEVEHREAIISNLDLIFKWATLHLDLKQANVLKPLQGMLLALFNMLKEDSYVMTEYEVSVILPCLALHVGNKIERLADNYRTMMRIISTLHDPAKVAQLILFGIDARAIRNSKSRKINLDEIGRLIVTQGWKVVGTKGLRSIASEIDSQTEAIRQGALVAIVAAWEKIDRDTEKIFKCIGRSLSSKGETLLKQRLEAVSGEPIPDFTKNQSKKTADNNNNNNSKKPVERTKSNKISAASRSAASTKALFADIDAMTTSLRSPPKTNIDVESIMNGNAENNANLKEDEFNFEFQEISDQELNFVVSQIENLEIDNSPAKNLAVSLVKKDSIGSSDGLGSPLMDYSTKQNALEDANPATEAIKTVTKIVACIDDWQTQEVKNEAGEARPCFDSLKKLTDIFAPENDVKNADQRILIALSDANLVPAIVERVCLVIEFGMEEKNGLSSIYTTRALTVLVKMMEHKDFVKTMGVDALKLLIKLTVQNLVFGKLGEASVGACNRIANYTAKHCNRSHMFLALISLSSEFPVKSQAQSLVVKMFSKTIRMEAKEPYLKGNKAYANIDDMSIYTAMHNLFEQEPAFVESKEVVGILKIVIANLVEHRSFPTSFSEKCNISLDSFTGKLINALNPVKKVVESSAIDADNNNIANVVASKKEEEKGDVFDNILKKIFDKIKSKETQIGVKELYAFKKAHPNVDTERFMNESSATFQAFILNQLKRLQASEEAAAATAAAAAAVTDVSLKVEGTGKKKSSNKMPSSRRSSGSRQSLQAMKERLAALKGNSTFLSDSNKSVTTRASIEGSSIPMPKTSTSMLDKNLRRNSTDPKRTSTGTASDFKARLNALRENRS